MRNNVKFEADETKALEVHEVSPGFQDYVLEFCFIEYFLYFLGVEPLLFSICLDKFGVQQKQFSLFRLKEEEVLKSLEVLLMFVGGSHERLENRNLDLVLFLKVRNSNSYLQSTGVG